MRLLRSDSVYKRRKDQKLRNKLKGKKKHKKLDAIYEKGYSKNHRGVQKVDSVELENAGNEFELRRSGRARKAPVLLDSSPVPPRKRRKVDIGCVEKIKRVDRAECEMACSNSRDGDGEIDGWRSRMRPRQKSNGFSARVSGESSLKGKRKLFQDLDGFEDCNEPLFEKKEHLVVEKLMVVKSKRPGRVEASNILENDNQEVDLGGGLEDGEQKNEDDILEVMDDAEALPLENDNQEFDLGGRLEGDKQKSRDGILEVMDKAEGLPLENGKQEVDLGGGLEVGKQENRDDIIEVMDVAEGLPLENKSELTSEIGVDCNMTSQIAKEKEISVLQVHNTGLKESQFNGNVETTEVQVELEKLACDVVTEPGNVDELDRGTADQVKYDGHPEDLLEDDTDTKPKGAYKAAAVADRKPRIKLGRRCGLCGGGTDGKPPKIRVVEGAGSDNEAYSGSSSAEDPNYDVWDGFGDQPGWLGRLLGPINDKFGIAGIWVHQQCAVWSPEVYFAGLGCLKNVRAALYRGRVLKCSRCKRPGATIGCRVDRCPKTYHLPCARAKSCTFDHRKFLIACNDHRYLFQPYGLHNALRMKKMKARKLKLELRKMSNDSYRKDIEAEEKWLENCGEDEEFLKRESKRLQRDLWRIAPTYIGGANSEQDRLFTGWESVAGLQHVIECMKEVVILPLLYPEFFNNLGLTPPRGVLLHGYPGTGKTLVVRALVGSCARGDRRIAYFARKGADCLGKYVGDAERQLRLLFQVAEKSQPSIIFFDEIDGLAPARTKQQDQTHNSVVSTLLALMDGVKSRGSVIVIGATNRPDAVDPALRRPGRFDREIYFPLPSLKDREAILSLHTQKWPKPIAGSLLKCVAQRTVGYAGADLQSLCTQAAIFGLRRSFPLQKVLSEAGANNAGRRCPAIPIFTVEERDWLKALSCAPPPCSQRESGTAVNDVVSSPLKSHLVSCLLQPLTQLLVCLSLDERVWLPPHLKKACKLVKNTIISVLDDRQVPSDNWWLQVDGLLQEVEVRDEIEKNLLLANFLVGETNLSSSNALDKDTEECSETIPIKNLHMGARTALSQEMSFVQSSKSGFQVLVCGNPRSGQRHLASSFLNCFVGSVDVWKLDLASISHEGHGDMVHGLTRILMRSSGANFSMLYMPLIDLWAVETYNKSAEDECEPSEVVMEREICPSAHVEDTESQTVVRKASYLWTSFIEQVESVRVNSSLIILATAEVPFSLLPDRIRDFFGNEILNCSLSSAPGYKVPRFSVQLDGEFDHDKVISSFASKLTNDLAQQVIQSLHGGNHVDINISEMKDCKMVDGDVSQVCHSKPCHGSPFIPVGVTNKTVKGKSNLQLAISTFGYQILCYPHFAELCWFTSKLKEGPCANASGPWKGWPFNACIVRPINSAEDVTAASSSSNIKSKEYGSVRGLLAVGLSAYRGEYNSLREVCSAVRKVLEAIVRVIDDKIQAGKDRTQFIRLLSQVAYLEDMVSSWAHTLQSLEVETHIPEANTNVAMEPFDNPVSRGICAEAHIPEVEDHIAEANTSAFVEPLDNHVSGGIFSEVHITEANLNAFVKPLDNPVSGDIFSEAHLPEANTNAFVEPLDNHVSGDIFSHILEANPNAFVEPVDNHVSGGIFSEAHIPEVEAHVPEANEKVFVEPFDNHVSRYISSEAHIPEDEAHVPEANMNVLVEPLDNHVSGDIFSEAGDCKIDDLFVNIHDSQVLEKSSQEVGLVNSGHSNPTGLDNDCADAGDEIAVTVQEPPHEAVLDDTSSLKQILEPVEVNIESSTAEATGDHTEPEHVPSVKLPNGVMESSSDSHAENCILSEDINQTSGGSNLNVDDSSGPKIPTIASVSTCFYQCCSECFVTLRNLLLRIITTEWKSKGSQSTVEDVHDFLASLSANLHLSLSKLCQDEISCGTSAEEGSSSTKHCLYHKVQAADMPDHTDSDKPLMADCDCHATSREEAECRFVLKDGVPADLDTGTDVSYHCKYEKLCLCFLIEWLVTSKEALG